MISNENFKNIKDSIILASSVSIIPIMLFILMFRHIDAMIGLPGILISLLALAFLALFGYFISDAIISILKELKK